MDLTKNEEKIISYYREMDETTKEAFIKIGEYYANSCITIKNLKKGHNKKHWKSRQGQSERVARNRVKQSRRKHSKRSIKV